MASLRARHRSRTASSVASGTCIAVRSPARCKRASLIASRLSFLIRSPLFFGNSEGAATSEAAEGTREAGRGRETLDAQLRQTAGDREAAWTRLVADAQFAPFP